MNKGLCVLAIAASMVLQFEVNPSQRLLFAADQASAPAPAPPVAASPIDQALIEIQSDEAAVRSAAAAVLIERGDVELIPQLDAIRAGGDRAV
ncbi:MAG: hypothetical protein OEV17_09600, partial [Nitrospira sp.]|nr:hypothetical protein [Nitrospira sp.]